MANAVLFIILFPPIYAFVRARDAGMKKWHWSLTFLLGVVVAGIMVSTQESMKETACELTTSIYKDSGSNITCLVAKDVNKVSDRHYRAKQS